MNGRLTGILVKSVSQWKKNSESFRFLLYLFLMSSGMTASSTDFSLRFQSPLIGADKRRKLKKKVTFNSCLNLLMFRFFSFGCKSFMAVLWLEIHGVFLRFFFVITGIPVVAQSWNAFVFLSSFFFSSATKWKDCAIVPSGLRALNTMTTNCDPMRVKVFTCWSRVLSWWWLTQSLLSVILYFNVFGLRSHGALRRKRSKYLQTHTQVVLFAANPH